MKKNAIRAIVRNDYAFTLFTKAAAMVIGVIASSLSKRYLGPALEGQLSYISSTLTTVAVIASLGLYQPYPYHRRLKGPAALDEFLNIFSAQFVLYAVIGCTLAAILRDSALLAVCLIAPIQVLANQLSFVIMVEDVKYKNVIFFSARIINTSIILLAFLTMSPSLLVALAMIVVGDIITIVLSVRRLGRFGNPLKVNVKFLREVMGFGFVAMLTTLMLTLNYNLDSMMLKWMGIEDAQRGFYSTGISLAGYGWLISDAFREVLFSRTAKSDAIDEVTMSLKFNFYITVAMLAAILAFGKPVIRILFGERYLPSFDVTVILLFGVLAMSYFKLIGTLLLAQGKKRMYLYTLLASAVINVVANYLMIPRMGIEGAALASVLSYTALGVLFVAYYMRTYHVKLSSLFIIHKSEIKRIVATVRGR